MMRRALTIVLVLALTLGVCPAALGEFAVPKMSAIDECITAYVAWLQELFEDEGQGKISHVGLADVNKDTLPELFFIYNEDGEYLFYFCYYADGEVSEFYVEENSLGYKRPSSLSLTRRRRGTSSEHCWVLQGVGKDDEGWNTRMFNVFQRSGDELTNELKFLRVWKGSRNRYYVDGAETLKRIYLDEVDDFNYRWPLAPATGNYKNRGVIKKVTSIKKWMGVRRALGTAANAWKSL